MPDSEESLPNDTATGPSHGAASTMAVVVDFASASAFAVIAARMAAKVARLRIFPNDDRGFDRTVVDVHGKALVVSQFTLMGDVRRGNRPSWAAAARPEDASPVVEAVARALEAEGVPVATGRFGAVMDVELVNDGPVTLVLDSDDLAAARR